MHPERLLYTQAGDQLKNPVLQKNGNKKRNSVDIAEI